MASPRIAFPTIGLIGLPIETPSVGRVDVALRQADLIISSNYDRIGRKADQVAYP